MNDTTLRIRKLLERHPEMTDAQVARKIGRDDVEGWERVAKERRAVSMAKIRAACKCGGLFDMCTHCRARIGRLD